MAGMTEARRLELVNGIQVKARSLETSLSAVVAHYTPAFFCWGAPGLGKSHMIRRILNDLQGATWRHHTAYATPKGLVLTLAEYPDALHVFEDCERMLRTELSSSILRAACGTPSSGERWITYETAHETLRFRLTGGIVIVSNANLARHNGPMQGVASRFRPMKWELTQDEVVATILTIAREGWNRLHSPLTAKQCLEVAHALIGMVQDESLETSLDVRLFTEHALPTYLYCLTTESGDWKDVLRSKMIGCASTFSEGQAERTRRLEDLALTISKSEGDIKAKLARWKTATELGQAIYYRHLKAAKARK